MAKEWIENLAEEVKQTGKDAAESYGREQHRAGIIDAQGKVFFLALVSALEQDFSELRSQLQGSAVACETSITKEEPSLVRLTRNRFPWFDAKLQHDGPDITLDYAQGRGTVPDKALGENVERKAVHFNYEVDSQDIMTVVESFRDNPRKFAQAEDLARHIVELLFKV